MNQGYIDPHIHMVSRTTDDYLRMAMAWVCRGHRAGVLGGVRPQQRPGFLRLLPAAYAIRARRAAAFGIDHYCWLCINPKEAQDVGLARAVIALIPGFLDQPNVLGVGEIGLNKNTKNELAVLEEQIALADRHNQLILVHTPHLEDKLKGTHLILDAIKRNGKIDPSRVLIDHVEEHTVKMVLDAGFWAGMTLYPETKCTPQRAVDILESYGHERLMMNSAGDWGPSDPLSVPKARLEMARRGYLAKTITQVTLHNPQVFLQQGGKFRVNSEPSQGS